MPSTHQSRVRPGDRWDGVTLTITRSGVTWASAVWSIQLRKWARGPVLLTITPTTSVDGETVTVSFHIPGADTAKLPGATTLIGEVTVSVPSGGSGEPTFGPYTLFTWDLETADMPQPPAGGYAITWNATAATYDITLNEGAAVVSSGATDFQLGTDIYINLTSKKAYLYVAETDKYHRITGVMVDGQATMELDQTGLSSPA